jgi:hypothetical protein
MEYLILSVWGYALIPQWISLSNLDYWLLKIFTIMYVNLVIELDMSDALVLRSAIDLMDSGTSIIWSNKYILPVGYNYNEDGYVITNEPIPMIRACVGISFGFLIGKLGMVEYVRQNMISLRMLNPGVHKLIVGNALWYAFRRTGLNLERDTFDRLLVEAFNITEAPLMNSNFVTWRRTWFSSTCDYNTVSKIIRLENSNKIDSDRELMTIDKKYITNEVAAFTGFSKSRIDRYWGDKEWNKKLRTIFTLDEALTKLANSGIIDPSRSQLAEISGLSVNTISRTLSTVKKMIEYNRQLELNANTKTEGDTH